MRRSLFLAASLLSCVALARAADVPLTYSHPDIDTTPKGSVQFHGPFGRETITVSADKLPAHDFLDISFDLLILRTWDGSLPVTGEKPEGAGPDFFRLALHNGPTLLYTTFSNLPDGPFRDDGKQQQYPSPLPGDTFPPATAADTHNTLGYGFPNPGPDKFYGMDAVYKIHFILPHTAASADFDMSGIHLQDINDESWGVANVTVKPLAATDVKKPTADQIDAAFKACLDPTSPDLPGKFQTLINGMDATTAYLATTLKPHPIEGLPLENALNDLRADDTKINERAASYAALVAMGNLAEPALRDARNKAVGEQRYRIDMVLITLGVHQPSDEERSALLATRVLEIINTPKALALRKRLSMY